MKALKKINNNFALCLDSNGVEMIAYGRGVGFGQFPCEVPLAKIERTYYNVSEQYQALIHDLPDEVFRIAAGTVKDAHIKYQMELNPNITFLLADHIAFSIQRVRKGLRIDFPFSYDVEHLYPNEYELAKTCVNRVRREIGVALPANEIVGIALHFINNNQKKEQPEAEETEAALETTTRIAEKELGIKISRSGYNYYRYCSHIRYLLCRIGENRQIVNGDPEMYEQISRAYPQLLQCSEKIIQWLNQHYGTHCTREEQLYLIIHLNRLQMGESI